MDFVNILLFFVSLYIGWNIGANDAANCLGPSVGAGVLSIRKATFIIGVFVLLGGFLQGSRTINSVGTGIVDAGHMSSLIFLCALSGAAILKTFYTFRGVPVSTTHAVIGALVGVSLFAGVEVDWGFTGGIFLAWVLTPFSAAILSYLTYRIVAFALRDVKFYFLQKYLQILVICSGIFLAYALGANNVGNAMGFAVGKGILPVASAGLAGGFFMALGAITFSKRTMNTIGSGITELDSWMAFAAQAGAAMTVYILTMLAIPTSITTAAVGGVGGVGLVKGVATIDKEQVFKIIRGWILTPLMGGVFAILMFKILSGL